MRLTYTRGVPEFAEWLQLSTVLVFVGGDDIVIDRKHLSNTDLSDLSTVGTCDIFVYHMRHRVM